MPTLLWLNHRFSSELKSDQSRKKIVLFTRFMGSIRSRRPDAECFSRQLDLKGISCLGGHPRDPEGQGKCMAHVPLPSVPPPMLDIINRSRSFLTEARESLAESFKHGVPGGYYQRCGVGIQDKTTCLLFQLWGWWWYRESWGNSEWRATGSRGKHLCRGDMSGHHVLLSIGGVFAVNRL